jgi:hypothetical protein
MFTAGCIDGNSIWLPTDTEIYKFSYPTMKTEKVISHPFFQNIHSVARFGDQLAVTSTGLDLVAFLDVESGSPQSLINVTGRDTWYRHSAVTDYRRVHSTRPHDGHPNYVFKIGDEFWVTRCTYDDAVCLSEQSRRIDIGRGRGVTAHDGVVVDDKVYFTTVDGRLAIADASTMSIQWDLDLTKMESHMTLRGWCRGLYIEGNFAFVGYSKLRQTKDRRKVHWMRRFRGAETVDQASVVCYDLVLQKKVEEWRFPNEEIGCIYGVMREPEIVGSNGRIDMEFRLASTAR